MDGDVIVLDVVDLNAEGELILIRFHLWMGEQRRSILLFPKQADEAVLGNGQQIRRLPRRALEQRQIEGVAGQRQLQNPPRVMGLNLLVQPHVAVADAERRDIGPAVFIEIIPTGGQDRPHIFQYPVDRWLIVSQGKLLQFPVGAGHQEGGCVFLKSFHRPLIGWLDQLGPAGQRIGPGPLGHLDPTVIQPVDSPVLGEHRQRHRQLPATRLLHRIDRYDFTIESDKRGPHCGGIHLGQPDNALRATDQEGVRLLDVFVGYGQGAYTPSQVGSLVLPALVAVQIVGQYPPILRADDDRGFTGA